MPLQGEKIWMRWARGRCPAAEVGLGLRPEKVWRLNGRRGKEEI